jgi:glycosyltransferase involved in cell wall biosynthesis
MVSHNYFDENSTPQRIPQIVRTRIHSRLHPPLDASFTRRLFEEAAWSGQLDYLLVVSTIEPRKNHETLLSAWEKLRVEGYPSLKLMVVGKLGWHHTAIVEKFRPWMERGDVFLLEGVGSNDLRLLYKHARATVCPSYGEGFDFAGVEAMSSGGAVVASNIPVHHEIYIDAAEYFNPYSVDDLSMAIERVINPANGDRRYELITKGAAVAARYTYDAILPQWTDFLKGRVPT